MSIRNGLPKISGQNNQVAADKVKSQSKTSLNNERMNFQAKSHFELKDKKQNFLAERTNRSQTPNFDKARVQNTTTKNASQKIELKNSNMKLQEKPKILHSDQKSLQLQSNYMLEEEKKQLYHYRPANNLQTTNHQKGVIQNTTTKNDAQKNEPKDSNLRLQELQEKLQQCHIEEVRLNKTISQLETESDLEKDKLNNTISQLKTDIHNEKFKSNETISQLKTELQELKIRVLESEKARDYYKFERDSEFINIREANQILENEKLNYQNKIQGLEYQIETIETTHEEKGFKYQEALRNKEK